MSPSEETSSEETSTEETSTDGQVEHTPLSKLGVLAKQTVRYDNHLDHVEIYTMRGLLTILRHGPINATEVVVCVGGAMGGLLGPDGGVYHQLGQALANYGIGVQRLSYRQPNDLQACVHDTLATIEMASQQGAKRFMLLGHSFGGAVVVQTAALLPAETVPAVVTFATQSGGCEVADQLGDRNLLFFHGTSDTILPHYSSEMVQMLAGTGEVVLLDGADHLLHPAGPEVLDRLLAHIPAVFTHGAG